MCEKFIKGYAKKDFKLLINIGENLSSLKVFWAWELTRGLPFKI